MARILGWLVAAAAVCLAALAATAADGELSPQALWRIRMGEVRHWKLWIAVAGTLLLALDLGLRALGRQARTARLRDALLLFLALATLFAWWHPYRGSLRAWLHKGDAYHYYMGAKYFPELGYTRLYACSVIADAEDGLAGPVARSQIRNLETNELESARRTLRSPGRCKRHFTPERWQQFKTDLQFFRRNLTVPLWFKLRVDHGYNPPPTWTVLGRLLTGTTPQAGRSQFFVLTALDPLLLLAMFGALAWGFGWRVACVAFLYWGTNQPANWEWVGGSIVRFDWLFASGAALACLRRGHPVAAGLLVAWATGVRVFPGAIAGGVGLAALLRMAGERTLRPTPAQLRFGAAFAGGLALLVALSAAIVGPGSWAEFARNSRLHVSTDSMNRTGLRPLLAFRHETRLAATLEPDATDPYARWREARGETSEARRPLLYALSVGYLALLAFALRPRPVEGAARRQPPPDWTAGVLGLGVVPVWLELGSYYFAFLALFACLARRRRDVAAALLALAAASWSFGTWGGPDRDVVVAHTSLAILLFVVYATLREGLGAPRDEATPAA